MITTLLKERYTLRLRATLLAFLAAITLVGYSSLFLTPAIAAPIKQNAKVKLTASPDSDWHAGQTVTFTVTVRASDDGRHGTPTGDVLLSVTHVPPCTPPGPCSGSAFINSETLEGGRAVFEFTVQAGTYSLSASYSGDDKFNGSESNVISQQVSVQPTCANFNATITGTRGGDVIKGTPGDDVIISLGGNDIIKGNGGADVICAGDGNDRVITGRGDDQIEAGSGNDLVLAGTGNNTINAGDGNDRVITGRGDDQIEAGSGNDLVLAGTGNNTVNGGLGLDLCIPFVGIAQCNP